MGWLTGHEGRLDSELVSVTLVAEKVLIVVTVTPNCDWFGRLLG